VAEASHLRHHLNELRGTLRWLRSLAPDGPRYKLWLGDLVEFTRVAFGADSPQAARVREVLVGRPRLPADADEAARTRDYLDRLDAFRDVLDGFQHDIRDPIEFVDLDPGTNRDGQSHRGA
jgi:hypothetical protein